ncbi:hypothetical protein D3C78_1318580 [compost metagenome]
MDEAHVEHAVGFVEHQDFHVGQVNLALAGQVEQAARAGDQNVHTLGNGLDLRVHADTAENAGADQWQVTGIDLEAVMHLGCQFAGRGQDQHARLARAMALRLVGVAGREQALEDRQGETAGFTSTCLCGDHQVAALQHGGNRPLLHGGRLGVARSLDSADKSLGETEGSKGHGQSCSRVGWARLGCSAWRDGHRWDAIASGPAGLSLHIRVAEGGREGASMPIGMPVARPSVRA